MGPAPSEVQLQAGAQGQRVGEMLAQGIQEGAKNYLTAKQIADQQERTKVAQQEADTGAKNAQTESDKLRMTLLSNDLQGDLTKNGPMSYVDRKSEWMQLFKFTSGGDADLAKSMYEGGAGALNRMSAGEMVRSNLIGMPSPQAPAAPAGQAPAGIPPTSPLAPFTGQPSAAVAPQGQPMPFGTSSNPAPGVAAPSPAVAPPTPVAAPALPPTPAMGGTVSTTAGQSQSASFSQSIQTVTSTPKTDLAKAVIQKYESGGLAPDGTISGKESAAVLSTLAPTLKVLQNSETAKYLAAGGSEVILQKAADQLNAAMQADPQFADYMKVFVTLPPEDAKTFLADKTQNRYLAQLGINQQNADTKEAVARGNLALTAAKIEGSLQMGLARSAAALKSSDNAATRNEATAYQTANAAFTAYAQRWSDARDKYMADHKGAGQAEVENYMDSLFADPTSALSQGMMWSSKLISRATGMDVSMVEQTLKGSNGFLFGWPAALGLGGEPATPPTRYNVPVVPGATAPGGAAAPQARPSGWTARETCSGKPCGEDDPTAVD